MSKEYFILNQKNILSSQHLMVPAPKVTILSITKQASTNTRKSKIQENRNNLIHPIGSPQTKAGLQYQQKQQKAHITWKLNTILLNDNLVKVEIRKHFRIMKMKAQHTQTFGTQ